jgi:hypothetical protein
MTDYKPEKQQLSTQSRKDRKEIQMLMKIYRIIY